MEPTDKTASNDRTGDANTFPEQETATETVTDANGKTAEATEEAPPSIDEQIEKLQKEVELNKDKYLRLVAEFENFKRRTAKERMETIQTAGKEVIISLLDVLDDCDRAENQLKTSKDVNEITGGIQLVFNKLRSTLQAKGLKPMESLNTDFDVEKHEAVSEIEVTDKSKRGKVIAEVVKGYYLNDKLIRFAKVIVGK